MELNILKFRALILATVYLNSLVTKLASPTGLASSAEKSNFRAIFNIFFFLSDIFLFDLWEGILMLDYKVCIEVQHIDANLNLYPNSDHNLAQTLALTFLESSFPDTIAWTSGSGTVFLPLPAAAPLLPR